MPRATRHPAQRWLAPFLALAAAAAMLLGACGDIEDDDPTTGIATPGTTLAATTDTTAPAAPGSTGRERHTRGHRGQ